MESNNKRYNRLDNLDDECNNILSMQKKFIFGMKSREISSIFYSIDRWIRTKEKNNKVTFKRGDIIEADLGLGYGFEMSYLHPCVVIDNSNAGFCLVVACSTNKFGQKNKYILDGYSSDGFKNNTGVAIDSLRCISKTRINKRVGRVSLEFYDKIIDRILNEYFGKCVLNMNNLKKDYEKLLNNNS